MDHLRASYRPTYRPYYPFYTDYVPGGRIVTAGCLPSVVQRCHYAARLRTVRVQVRVFAASSNRATCTTTLPSKDSTRGRADRLSSPRHRIRSKSWIVARGVDRGTRKNFTPKLEEELELKDSRRRSNRAGNTWTPPSKASHLATCR